MNRRALLAALAGACVDAEAHAATTVPGGVNIAGLEFNPERLPGRLDTDYVAPRAAEIAYYRAAGARVIRIPFLWERLQPVLNGALDSNYLGLIDAALNAAGSMRVVLDAHQFGRRREGGAPAIIGENPAVPADAFAHFWSLLATHCQHRSNVIFNLQNEPHDQNSAALVETQNRAIAAIRAAGARQLVLVSGNAWSGAHSWAESGNASAMLGIRDPAQNIAFDVHQYLDRDSSGSNAVCVQGAGGRLHAFTAWARQHGKRGFLGEFGADSDATCLSELSALLEDVRAAPDVWLGWTYWAGGAWWPPSYALSVKPESLDHPSDRPQMRVLRRYFA